MGKKYCVVLFYSTSLAIRGEKIAKKAGLNVKLIPTPRHLSSDCGTALRFEKKDRDELICAYEGANLDYDRISPM
jgi:hypothetical protein